MGFFFNRKKDDEVGGGSSSSVSSPKTEKDKIIQIHTDLSFAMKQVGLQMNAIIKSIIQSKGNLEAGKKNLLERGQIPGLAKNSEIIENAVIELKKYGIVYETKDNIRPLLLHVRNCLKALDNITNSTNYDDLVKVLSAFNNLIQEEVNDSIVMINEQKSILTKNP